MSKQLILILLGGGRGNWPNFWSVRAYQPSLVYLIRPDGDYVNDLYMTEFLDRALVEYDDTLEALPAFDVEKTRETCLKIIDQHQNDTILINITQAPKMMAIGACYAARESGENVYVFHRDTVRGVSYPGAGIPPPNPVTMTATVDDYLAAYGRTANENFEYGRLPCSRSELSRLARSFATRQGPFSQLIKQMRWFERNATTNWLMQEVVLTPRRPQSRDRLWHKILQDMADVHLLSHTHFDASKGEARFSLANPHVWSFLNGTWLELYAYDQALEYRDKTGHRVFSDCRVNLEIPNHDATNEIDLACLTPTGLLIYASCKTSSSKDPTKSPLSDANLSDVVDRAALLGGAYCGKMLITTAPRQANTSSQQAAVDNFGQQAKLRQVEVVYAEDLSNLHLSFDQAMKTVRENAR